MVPIIDYYGLIIYFKNEAVLPIQVFGKRNELLSKATINFENGLLMPIQIDTSHSTLDEVDMKNFKLLVEKNSSEIIKLWLDNFLYKNPIEVDIIKQKLVE
ncbi:MAG: hypothetical protein R2852_01070 [Bacteroidia bacterium]